MHLLLDAFLEGLQLVKHLPSRELIRGLLSTNNVQLSTESVPPLVAGTALADIELVPDCVLHAQKTEWQNETSRRRTECISGTHQLNLEGVDLSLDFILLRIVLGLVRLARAIGDWRELLNFDGSGSRTGCARKSCRPLPLGSAVRTVRGGGFGFRCHYDEEERTERREG